MKKSIVSILFLLAVVLLVLQGCTTNTNDTATPTSAVTPAETTTANDVEISFTLEDLAKYDGTNGNPAYIAVDGVVYDVSNVPQWRNGQHNGFTAGEDLSEEIKNISPHGVSKLTGLTIVGKLTQ